jgi:hypothetical protein
VASLHYIEVDAKVIRAGGACQTKKVVGFSENYQEEKERARRQAEKKKESFTRAKDS